MSRRSSPLIAHLADLFYSQNNVSYMRNIPIEVLDGNVIEYVETVCAVVSEVEVHVSPGLNSRLAT